MYKNGMALVVLRGNLTRDPEFKYTPNGAARTTGSLAINTTYKDKTGALQERVSFIPITVWGPTAERVSEFCKKGQELTVIGELRQERWEADGQNKTFIHVVAQRVDFGDKPKGKDDASPGDPTSGAVVEQAEAGFPDEAPF
jgi:single-strand DNA-binding protein